MLLSSPWRRRTSSPVRGKRARRTRGTEGVARARADPSRSRLQKKKIVIFYGSQTGTAEDYGTRIAKEAKARYGLSSLVCDPEECVSRPSPPHRCQFAHPTHRSRGLASSRTAEGARSTVRW